MGTIIKEITESIFDGFKRFTPALFALSLLTGLLLFLPDGVLKRMKLDNLPIIWNRIIGILFLLTVTLIITIAIFTLILSIKRKYIKKKIRKDLKTKINKLSSMQKSIIIRMLRSESKSIELDSNSGDTIYLVNNLFIYSPSQIVSYGLDDKMICTYVPQPYLLELYNTEPALFN